MTRLTLTRRATLASLAALALPAFRASAAERKVSVALDWTPNTNHIGLFVAREKGFYRAAGLAVDILPYTDTSASALVANHVADFGVMGSIGLMTQRAAGADLLAAYAIVQTETGRVVFKAGRSDITRPKDLDGKTYGGFGSAWENALLSSIIRHDGGKGEFQTVTLGTSAYQALESGAVDFTLEVSTWEGVKAALDGVRQTTFRYADYGVPDEHTAILGTSRAYLDKHEDDARAFLKATRQGYDFAVDHPDEAAELLVKANSDALPDGKLVRASLQALNDGHYFRPQTGTTGRIDPKKMETIGAYLFEAKILKDSGGKVLASAPDFGAAFRDLL